MTPADIDAGLRLCRAAGWNQVESDWRCFLDLNPEGCRVAESDGRVAGTVTTLRFEDRFSWISMLLVDPEMRRRGIGSLLLREALRVLADMETVRLDATPAGKEVYDQHGFVSEDGLSRMSAKSPRVANMAGVRRMTDSDLPGILAFDREVFGADRSAIVQHLRRSAPEYALVVESQGAIRGFSLGRHGFHSEHVGPVVAVHESVACNLVSACLAQQTDRPWVLDAPQHNEDWSRWLNSMGFVEARPFIRMFKGSNRYPGRPWEQWAIAGPEFG